MQSNLTVIIPTLSNTEGLLYLLDYLKNYPVIVVDNSPSKRKENTCRSLKNCLYLPQTTNQGFARAINLSAAHIKTPWMLILNDDIKFPRSDILEMLISVAKTKQWSAISPVLQSPKGKTENLGYRLLPVGKVELNYDQACHGLDGITAACLLINTSAFLKLSGFDERFFAYLEDVDLFLRLKYGGYKFGIATDIKVIHNHMSTSSKMGNFKAKHDLRNWMFLIIKHWGCRKVWHNLPSIIIERGRNFSGYLKSTVSAHGLSLLIIIPQDLFWVIISLILFPFRRPSTLK